MFARRMTGAELAGAILDAARFAGFQATHFCPARTAHGWRTPLQGDKGYPDLTLARRGDVLVLELKGDHDRLRDEQVRWLAQLGAPDGGRVLAGIVTPGELDDVVRYLVGRASEAELRDALHARWEGVAS
jgi:hypothetical protein